MSTERHNNSAYQKEFQEACKTGDTRELAHLIAMNQFEVNDSMAKSLIYMPIVEAVKAKSLSVINLLLSKGAEINYRPLNGQLTVLATAVKNEGTAIVQFLLNRGADVAAVNFQALRAAMEKASSERDNQETAMLLLNATVRLLRNKKVMDAKMQKVFQYSLLLQAIVRNDVPRVTQLLLAGTYTKYASALSHPDFRPALLAFRFNRPEVLKAFIRANVDVIRIYFKAASIGNIELLDMCLNLPGFNRHCRDQTHGNTALHVACSSEQLEVIKLLVNKYGLSFHIRNNTNRTPLCIVTPFAESKIMHDILGAFPELNMSSHLTYFEVGGCANYVTLLEHGVCPRKLEYTNFMHFGHDSPLNLDKCKMILHVQKLIRIDRVYGNFIAGLILPIGMKEFQTLTSPHDGEYQIEIEKMWNCRISQSTLMVPGKRLFDVIYFSPNEAARYSRNAVLLNIYQQSKQDFQEALPHYGFILNHKLRRGEARRQRLEEALNLICVAFGTGLPESFAELILGNFSNSTIEDFSIKKIYN